MTDITGLTAKTTAESTDKLYIGRSPYSASDDGVLTVDTLFSTYGMKVHNVMSADYGAVRDGTTDDSAAIQAAVDAIGVDGGGILYFPGPGTYAIETAITLTDKWTGNANHYQIIGSGLPVIKATANIDAIILKDFDGGPTNGGTDSDTAPAIDITGLRFTGNSFAGQCAIKLQRARHGTISHCVTTTNLDYGIWLGFCLEYQVDLCQLSAKENALRVGYSDFAGADAGDSNSNVFSARNVRFLGNGDATGGTGGSSAFIKTASGATLINCVFEGAYPSRYDIEYDSENSTSAQAGFDLVSPHFEHGGTVYGLACIGVGSGTQATTFRVSNVDDFVENIPLCHSFFSASTGSTILFEGLRHFYSGMFEDDNYTAGVKWIFINACNDTTDATYWESGNVSSNVVQFGSGFFNGIQTAGTMRILAQPSAGETTPRIAIASASGIRNTGGAFTNYTASASGSQTNMTFVPTGGYSRYTATCASASNELRFGSLNSAYDGMQVRWDITQTEAGGGAITLQASSVIDPNSLLSGYDTTPSTIGIIIGEYRHAVQRVILTFVTSGLDRR